MQADALRSAVLWDSGSRSVPWRRQPLARLLPKHWMPVMAATAVELPPSVDLTRASASDAAGGLVLQGSSASGRTAAGSRRRPILVMVVDEAALGEVVAAAAAAAEVVAALPCAARSGVTQRPTAPCRGPASGAMPLPRA